MKTTIIPAHTEGKHNDLSESRSLAGRIQAVGSFHRVRSRLLHPEQWHDLAGAASATFQLCDENGHPVSHDAQKGDLCRIDLPGPGPSSGGGYDWVRVDDIEYKGDVSEGRALFALRLAACRNPGSDDDAAAHFFREGATSTFVLQLNDTTLELSYHGRNETPNLDAAALTDKLRNAVTGGLAITGLSEMQWSALLKGMMWNE